MKSEKEIKEKIKEIEADKHYKTGVPQDVFKMLPVTMSNLILETERRTLEWILGEKDGE